MTDLTQDSNPPAARGGFQLGLLSAWLIAALIAALAAKLLLLPPRTPAHTVRPQPRPELLDKPHRHRAAPEPSAVPAAR